MSRTRVKKFQEYMKKENLDGFIINRHVSILYLSDFTGGNHQEPDGVLVITRRGADLLTDSRYWEQAKDELKGVKLIPVKGERIAALKDIKAFQGKNWKFGYEADYLTVDERQRLQNSLPNALLVPSLGVVEQFSQIKDRDEIKFIKKAAEIADTAFDRILGYLKPGLREIEVAAELEYQMKMLGSQTPAFETIVASGYRSALPHGLASEKKIARGDFVTFDFGATYKDYVSDMTRTVVIGKASARQKKIYNIVLRNHGSTSSSPPLKGLPYNVFLGRTF